jgi:hypothetical protein
MKRILLVSIFLIFNYGFGQKIAPVRIHYGGGGDWYGNKTTWRNILKIVKDEFLIDAANKEVSYKISDPEFFQYPICYLAGHGNIRFTSEEVLLLRRYLVNGGFLFADDDYGMDRSFRREMKKVFPELKFVELPFSHPIYHVYYDFKNGLPKIHEHAGGPPHGYGLIYDGRLVCFYSFNTDISDGCEDAEIHNDPQEVRMQALKMAVNIFLYAILN